MKVSSYTVELIKELEVLYPDKYDVDNTLTDFERGKLAGVIELVRKLRYSIGQVTLNDVPAIGKE